MQIHFDEETHVYTIDGRPVPSVTEVTAILTSGKFADTNSAMIAQAQRRGTAVHEICEMLDYGVEPEELDVAPELVGYVNAYLSFKRDWRPEWEYVEKMVHTGSYCGRVDRVGKIDGNDVILDIKTTASMDRLSKLSLLFQLYGYQKAMEFMGLLNAPAAGIGLQLKKDGKYTLHRADMILERYLSQYSIHEIWLDLLQIAKIKGGYKWKN